MVPNNAGEHVESAQVASRRGIQRSFQMVFFASTLYIHPLLLHTMRQLRRMSPQLYTPVRWCVVLQLRRKPVLHDSTQLSPGPARGVAAGPFILVTF